MDLNQNLENLTDWSPIRFYWRNNEPLVDWCYMEKTRFTDSFFDVTIQKRFYQPFNLLFRHQTPIEFLGELYEKRRGLVPDGFIFHLSRCGSTLVSQMLAALPQNIVLSEPPPINSILSADAKNPQVTDEQKIEWLKWFISAAGEPRNDEKHYFIKFDSWSTLNLELISKAFPDVPWIFLYRNPVEVIVSHLRQPGAQMIPGAIEQLLPGLDLREILQLTREEYCARVLAKICENVLKNAKNPNVKLFNYHQLPEITTSEILKHFQISYSNEDLEIMNSVTKFNAKTPQLNFTPDSEEKKKEANETVRRAAEKYVNLLYDNLETFRLKVKNN
jgi:hypothetical protein